MDRMASIRRSGLLAPISCVWVPAPQVAHFTASSLGLSPGISGQAGAGFHANTRPAPAQAPLGSRVSKSQLDFISICVKQRRSGKCDEISHLERERGAGRTLKFRLPDHEHHQGASGKLWQQKITYPGREVKLCFAPRIPLLFLQFLQSPQGLMTGQVRCRFLLSVRGQAGGWLDPGFHGPRAAWLQIPSEPGLPADTSPLPRPTYGIRIKKSFISPPEDKQAEMGAGMKPPAWVMTQSAGKGSSVQRRALQPGSHWAWQSARWPQSRALMLFS